MAKSGMEIALQMMGLGPVMEQVRMMAESGKADQIIAFLEKAPEIAARLERIEEQQRMIIDGLFRAGIVTAPSFVAFPDRRPVNGGSSSGDADGGRGVTLWDDGGSR